MLHGGLDAGKIAGPVLGGLVAHAIGLAAMFQVIPVVIMAVYLARSCWGRGGRACAPLSPPARP